MIAPHRGIEYVLIASGIKPAAILDGYSKDCRSWVELPVVMASVYPGGGKFGPLIVIANSEERLKRLVHELSAPHRDHFRLGLLLGYSLKDVRDFIELVGERISRF